MKEFFGWPLLLMARLAVVAGIQSVTATECE